MGLYKTTRNKQTKMDDVEKGNTNMKKSSSLQDVLGSKNTLKADSVFRFEDVRYRVEMKGGDNYGKVTLNGQDLTRDVFTRNCASMTQQDNHWAFLTCRETLDYAADLCVNDTEEQKRARIDAILSTVGLNDCADTKVGNQFLKGLSGGQKRRLSLAVSLLTDPKVLFLDEPTSGLDAAAAAAIMSFLKELAQATNIAIVCTIHQPSTAVFNGFDRVMLLL